MCIAYLLNLYVKMSWFFLCELFGRNSLLIFTTLPYNSNSAIQGGWKIDLTIHVSSLKIQPIDISAPMKYLLSQLIKNIYHGKLATTHTACPTSAVYKDIPPYCMSWTVEMALLWSHKRIELHITKEWVSGHWFILQVQLPGVFDHRWIKISGILIPRTLMCWINQI